MTLFWKIFLGFWLTAVLVAAAAFQLATLLHRDSDLALHGALAAQFDRVQEALRQDGSLALLAQGEALPDAPEELVVATDDNQLLWPSAAGAYTRQLLAQVSGSNPTLKDVHGQMLSVGVLIRAETGEGLKLLARQPLLPARQPLFHLALALAISAAVCGALARWLTAPVRRLSAAARRLADGDLSARVAASPARLGRDELAQLAQDFDHMAARLQQAMEARRQLLHDVSHELRTPLARIRLAVELARGRQPDDAERALQRIDRECGELAHLIDELLRLPQHEAGTDTRQEHIDLAALAADRVEAARLDADAGGKQLRFASGAADTAIVAGQGAALARVVDNLVGNALRHAPSGSEVAVTVHGDDHAVVLSVQDAGPGVPDGELERIFEPFVRLDTARARHGPGGYGLGLALVKKIVEQHRGTVCAINTHPGLCVTVTLPRSRL